MATPLYRNMKAKGSTFYSFPSSGNDMNNDFQNDSYKLRFSKFILLNIPEQEIPSVPNTDDQTKGILNFNKSMNGQRFYNFQPDGILPTDFGSQLVESLRNYVANSDETLHQSRINVNTDFYNVNEKTTPTEMIFWKWCRKMNLLDLEPALHKIDWDKNLPDFDNNNGTDNNFFQKYLWKERDVNYYSATLFQGQGNIPTITIDTQAKFKVGDTIILSGDTGSELSANTSYSITYVDISGSTTTLKLDGIMTSGTYNITVYLKYNKLIQYIGEIQAVSKVQTSKQNYTEITAQIPHQAGQTPTVLFDIESNLNYYPGLEMPILPVEQQEEIVGAENMNSPIRLNPSEYPGSFYGYFDTEDKTYKCSNGDKLRYKGAYYGVLLNNNIGVDNENYFQNLEEFDSSNIDGLKLDFDRDHYLKMNLPGNTISNFDEFNSTSFDNVAPKDFNFNAILWYYDIDDGSGEIISNLYGVEFLNNPNDDGDDCDTDYNLITTYKKLVSNGAQDGLSYIFNLNVNYNIDNDALPMSYDPTTVYNQFGFDMYQNILQSNAKLQDNFISIISGFTNMNEELFKVKSMVYSQTDINTIKSQISNLNNLLQLYSTFQFVNSSTALINTNYNGAYPTLQVDVINTKYDSITNVNISDVFNYNGTNSGNSYIVSVPTTNQLLLNIYNNNNDIEGTANILLNSDLYPYQSMDIYIKPNMSESKQKINLNIRFNNGSTTTETNLISNLDLPTDLSVYNALNVENSVYNNAYFTNDSLSLIASKNIITGTTLTQLNVKDDVFTIGDYVYIDNFYFTNGSLVYDYSGVYQISSSTAIYSNDLSGVINMTGNTISSGNTIMNSVLSGDITGNTTITGDYNNDGNTIINGNTTINGTSLNYTSIILSIQLNTNGLTLRSNPKISYYKGYKINILRVSNLNSSSITDRYKITKELI